MGGATTFTLSEDRRVHERMWAQWKGVLVSGKVPRRAVLIMRRGWVAPAIVNGCVGASICLVSADVHG